MEPVLPLVERGEPIVHPVYPGDQGRGHEDHRKDGKHLDDLVLFDVDQPHEGVLKEFQPFEAEIGVVDERPDVFDHDRNAGVSVVREAFTALDAGEEPLAVEDALAQDHGVLLQAVDVQEHLLVNALVHVVVGGAEGGDLARDDFDHVGVEVDPGFEDRDQDVVSGRIGAVVHLNLAAGFAEGAKVGVPLRDEESFAQDKGDGFGLETALFEDGEGGVADDGLFEFGIPRRGFDLFGLLTGEEVDVEKALNEFAFLGGRDDEVDPQQVVVPQLLENAGIGVTDDLIDGFQVQYNHGFVLFSVCVWLKFVRFGRSKARPRLPRRS